jgi:glucose-6-phosphate 1-dehydrogenase
MRRDEVDAAWRWVDSIIAAWESSNQKVETYMAGSWGPSGSSLLLGRDGRAWHADSE